MVDLVKQLLIPGSITFFILALLPGIALLFRKGGRLGRAWITGLVLFYWAASTPALAVWMLRATTRDYPRPDAQLSKNGVGAIVVLGAGGFHYQSGDESMSVPTRDAGLRVLEAARLFRLMDRPWVVPSGGFTFDGVSEAEMMGAALRGLGVPPDRLVLERDAMTTREHAIYVPPLLKARAVRRFVLVTSATHMPRALGVFRAAGLDPIPATPELFAEYDQWSRVERWLPSKTALAVSESMCYAGIGTIYYRRRGWI
jgi:uncharacterized SAM-binding protein YcdF (DUF218 family)